MILNPENLTIVSDPYDNPPFERELAADLRDAALREARFLTAADMFTRRAWPRSLTPKADKALTLLNDLRRLPKDKDAAWALATHCGNTKYVCQWKDSLPFRHAQRLALACIYPHPDPA